MGNMAATGGGGDGSGAAAVGGAGAAAAASPAAAGITAQRPSKNAFSSSQAAVPFAALFAPPVVVGGGAGAAGWMAHHWDATEELQGRSRRNTGTGGHGAVAVMSGAHGGESMHHPGRAIEEICDERMVRVRGSGSEGPTIHPARGSRGSGAPEGPEATAEAWRAW